MRVFLKFCSIAILVLLVIIALGPANWQPRTGLGWQVEHFLGYFAITSLVCLAWPRPIVVGLAVRCWRACKLSRRIALPIFWQRSAAQVER